MKKLKFTTKPAIALYGMLAAVLLVGCSSNKEGDIVKDVNGKYYRLTGEGALGSERYRLIEVDTTKFKRF